MSTRSNRRSGGGNDENKRRFTAKEKGKGKMPSKSSKESEEGDSWDWRDYPGVLGPVLDQKRMAICWAISLVRAVNALLNINLPHVNQMNELSIQHVVNNVKYNDDDGIQNIKRAYAFAKKPGLCTASQCPSKTHDNNVARKFECNHPKNINTLRVDDFAYLTDFTDDALRAIVRQQPVIGILRNTGAEFSSIRSRIYRSPPGSLDDESFHQVLIIGYGFDSNNNPYWIIQNSHGETWGEGGYGYVHRRVNGQGSEFFAVAYPRIRGYPRSKDSA